MFSNGSKNVVIVAGLVAGAAVSAAHAAISTQTVTIAPGQISSASGSAQPTIDIPAAFSKFNSSLGTLTGVSFSLTYAFSSVVTGPSAGGGISSTGPFGINGTPFNQSGVGQGSGTGGGGLLPGTFNYVLGPVPEVPDNPLSTYLSPYTIDFIETTALSVGSPGSYNVAVSVASSSSVVATYTYTPAAVPEPASLSLVGLAALGLRRRRRTVR